MNKHVRKAIRKLIKNVHKDEDPGRFFAQARELEPTITLQQIDQIFQEVQDRRRRKSSLIAIAMHNMDVRRTFMDDMLGPDWGDETFGVRFQRAWDRATPEQRELYGSLIMKQEEAGADG